VAARSYIAGAVFGSEGALHATYGKIGVPTRTPLTIFANISQEDISKAIVLAGMGAIVSFGVMLLLKVLIRRLREIVVLSR
jgi:ABC-type sulfate transport system permease component